MELEGMIPAGVRALSEELRKAESALESAGNELWSLLQRAGLATAHADTIRRLSMWAGQKVPDIHRRLLLLERLETQDPRRFANGAPVYVHPAVFAPGVPLPVMGDLWDRAGQQLQAIADPEQNSGDSAAEIAKGAVESIAGFGGFLWNTSQVRQMIDPDGWIRDPRDSAEGLVYGVKHPVEFLKAITDWDTWVTNPDRAFGHLTPDLLLSAATAGAGGAAAGAGRAARAAEDVADLGEIAKIAEPAQVRPDGTWSWRGLTLGPEINRMVEGVFSRIRAAEQRISPIVRSTAKDLGAKMEGYPEFVLKGEDRFKEKPAKQIGERPLADPNAIAANIHDGIRYTFTFPGEGYTEGFKRVKEALERSGFRQYYQKSSWGTPGYKGINTRWRDPESGQQFELQFHTPESWHAKQITHDAYEKREDPTTPQEELDRIDDWESEIFDAVPVPEGAADLPDFSSKD
ncbi:hypothetical protein [Spongiactinospora sp. TRM90649]|uniref:hypothetical protein n=1 Tax=Spongiactinospora sp. TRM90649 TaxID=3031114 RepID=UPI0023F8EA16|nr:hypothetical protein [Spongiactinospora sp. TRM90649]MDF5751118.1 hypothetical protein [Spongiactinospora sp. TRM90649]